MSQLERSLLPHSVRPPAGTVSAGAVILCDSLNDRVGRWVELFRQASISSHVLVTQEASPSWSEALKCTYDAIIIQRTPVSAKNDLESQYQIHNHPVVLGNPTFPLDQVSPHYQWTIDNALWIRGEFIVAVGVSHLPAAVILGKQSKKRVIYDATTQLFLPGMPENSLQALQEKVQKNLITEAHIVTTTSYSLATSLAETNAILFPSIVWDIPALSLRSRFSAPVTLKEACPQLTFDSPVLVLPCAKEFPGRDKIDLVLAAWSKANINAKLVVYGNFENDFYEYLKQQAAHRMVLDRSVFLIHRPNYPTEALNIEGCSGCILPTNPVNIQNTFTASCIFDLLLQGLPVLGTTSLDYQLLFGSFSKALCLPMQTVDEVSQAVQTFIANRREINPLTTQSPWEIPKWIHSDNPVQKFHVEAIQDIQKLKENSLKNVNSAEITQKLIGTLTTKALETLSEVPEL